MTTPHVMTNAQMERELLAMVSAGFCFPVDRLGHSVSETSSRRRARAVTMMANLAARGHLRRVALKVYAMTEMGRERLAELWVES